MYDEIKLKEEMTTMTIVDLPSKSKIRKYYRNVKTIIVNFLWHSKFQRIIQLVNIS